MSNLISLENVPFAICTEFSDAKSKVCTQFKLPVPTRSTVTSIDASLGLIIAVPCPSSFDSINRSENFKKPVVWLSDCTGSSHVWIGTLDFSAYENCW